MSAPASSSSSCSSAAPCFSPQPGYCHGPPMSPCQRRQEDGDDEQQHALASATGAASAGSKVQLHRHALESVFAFLNRGGLAVALCVSRDWQAAVGSMRGNGLSAFGVDVLVLLDSPCMLRHFTRIATSASLTVEVLTLIHARMPQLLHLDASGGVDVAPSSDMSLLILPPLLQTLELGHVHIKAADTNLLLRSISQLAQLRKLRLKLRYDVTLSFAPLVSLPLLRYLHLYWTDDEKPLFSDAQVDQLRALVDVDEFHVRMHDDNMVRLLRPPHALRWQSASHLRPHNDDECALLPHLRCLQTLVVHAAAQTHFDFLPRIQALTRLDVGLSDDHPSAADTSRSLMGALQHCPALTALTLASEQLIMTPEQLAACLAHMPLLNSLRIYEARLPSLSFLALPSLALSLRELSLMGLSEPRPDPSELHHLHGLRHLHELMLVAALSAPLDAQGLSLFRPPSFILPALHSFIYKEKDDESEWDVSDDEEDQEDDMMEAAEQDDNEE